MSTGALLGDRWAHRTQPVPDDIEDADAAPAAPAAVLSESVAAPSNIASRAPCRLASLPPRRRNRHRRGAFGRSIMMISLFQLGAPSSPSGLGAVNSTCSTVWPLASRTVLTSAGRKGPCWASRNLFTEWSLAAARPRRAGDGDMSAERSGTPGLAPAVGALKPVMST